MAAVLIDALIARIRWASDSPGTARLTTADLVTEVNASWQALREKVSDSGSPLFLKSATGTLTVGPLTGASFGSLDLPSDWAHTYGLDLLVNGQRFGLAHGEFANRNEHMDRWGNANGVPVEFDIYNVGVEAVDTVGVGKMALFPAPDAAYPYTHWYLPQWTPIALGNAFNAVTGWDDWVVWDNVIKIASRDNDMANTYQIAAGEREKAEQRILHSANTVQKTGPVARVDVAGMSRRNRSLGLRRQ